MNRTTYRFDVRLSDVGEYDTKFMADVVSAIAYVVGEMGSDGTGFVVAANRVRDEEG